MTTMLKECGFQEKKIISRQSEIESVVAEMEFSSATQLKFASTRLDTYPLSEIIAEVATIIDRFDVEKIYVPHRGDAHTDHFTTFNAVKACCKWFRFPTVKSVLSYETVSETDFSITKEDHFFPNKFVDITQHLEQKLKAISIYQDELGLPPFPRSKENLAALASLRGSQCGVRYAEAFCVLKEII